MKNIILLFFIILPVNILAVTNTINSNFYNIDNNNIFLMPWNGFVIEENYFKNTFHIPSVNEKYFIKKENLYTNQINILKEKDKIQNEKYKTLEKQLKLNKIKTVATISSSVAISTIVIIVISIMK